LAVTKSQVKLTAAMAALVVFAVLVWGVVAERGLRRAELERVARSLEERAALVTELARGVPFRLEGRAHLDAIADRAGQAASARVTLIAPDGTVVGDSNVPVANLERVANHADRPEVSAALSGRIGSSTRRSATVGRELYYLAAPVADGGVVRVAVDLSHLDAAVSRLRWELWRCPGRSRGSRSGHCGRCDAWRHRSPTAASTTVCTSDRGTSSPTSPVRSTPWRSSSGCGSAM
jgi:two-component system phosphate regulon sensor histidine kinase PhoR